MVIVRENENATITFNSALLENMEIQKVLDFIRYLESVSTNQGTEEQAAELAKEADKNWWKKNKARFLL